MKVFKFGILVVILLAQILSRKQDLLDLPEESYQLIEVTEENYKSYLKNEFVFLFVHNPWCSWSQKMEKKLTKINLYMKLEHQPFYIGKIDSTVQSVDFLKLESKYASEVYPKLLFYLNGELKEEYHGQHVKNEIMNWIKKRIYSSSLPFNVATQDIFDYKLKNTKSAFLYFPDALESKYLKSLESESLDDDQPKDLNLDSKFKIYKQINTESIASAIAKQAHPCSTTVFYYTLNTDLIKKYQVKETPLAYFALGNNTASYEKNEEFTEEGLKNFCFQSTHTNLFKGYDEKAVEAIFINKKPGLILFRNKFDNKTEYEEIKLETISWMNRDLNVVITDIEDKLSYKLAKLLGVGVNDLPSIRLLDFNGADSTMRNFIFSRELTSENILDFMQKWEEGNLQEHRIYTSVSQTGKDNSNSPVFRISMNLYYEKVIMNRKNVLVYYYSEWCSHCKKYLPVFDIISKKLNLILFSLVQIDVGAYYQPSIGVTQVPTIHLYKAGDKVKPEVFEGKIGVKALLEFIRTHAPATVKDDL